MLRDRNVTLLKIIKHKNKRICEINIILNEPAPSLKLWEPSFTLDGIFKKKVANEVLRSCSSNIR